MCFRLFTQRSASVSFMTRMTALIATHPCVNESARPDLYVVVKGIPLVCALSDWIVAL